VDEFQIVITREKNIRDEITVVIELKPGTEDRYPFIAGQMAKDLAEANENLRFNIRQAEKGSLPRFELKAKRLIDKRGVE